MTRYALPDGTEVAAATDTSASPSCVWIDHPQFGLTAVNRALLTEVPPSLPEEPPIWTVVIDASGAAWQRHDEHWQSTHEGHVNPYPWEDLVRSHGPLTRMLPDPADDAPELPYELIDGATRLRVEAVGESVRLSLEEDEMCTSFDVDREHAPRVVGAIARAARDARRTNHNTQEGS